MAIERPPRTYRLSDLGCKVNQYETQLIAESLEAAGLRPAGPGEAADLCVVNTCAVTGAAAAKSARAVRQLRRANPGATVVAAGCAVSAAGREATIAHTGADLAWAQHEKLELPGLGLTGPTPSGISRLDGHCRAFVKVQDGCPARCSYCIVPLLRGESRSRPMAEVRTEAAALEAAGHRELVLSGVHMGFWGRDLSDRPELHRLAAAVLEAAPRCRLRLSSLDPSELTDGLLELMAAEPRFCPHLHLALQSGDDGVLAAMRRRYTAASFMEVVGRVRAALSRPALTTDVMVGFPGETRSAFDATLALCRRAGFSRLHVFPFSARPGTDAAALPGRVPAAEIRSRSTELITLGQELAAAFAASCVGSEEEILAEEPLAGGWIAGYSARYVRTRFRHSAPRMRELYRARLERSEGGELIGEIPAQS